MTLDPFVIVVMKNQIGPVDPFDISAPSRSLAYQWVRTSVFGEPDANALSSRIATGWTFVDPNVHDTAKAVRLSQAVRDGHFILMQHSSQYVESERAKEREKAELQLANIIKELAAMGIHVEQKQGYETV
jgi:hypothetical protein